MRNQILFAAAICASLAYAQEPGQKTFTSAGEACNALLHAVQSNNEQALETIIGKGVISPDKEAAELERHQFAEKYSQMHRLVQQQNGAMVLHVGAENWPFPLPLVSNNGKWFFDSEAGKEEIRYRMIGENEVTAMEICDRFAAAKKQGVQKASTGDAVAQFVQKLNTSSASGPQNFQGYTFRVVNGGNLGLVAWPAEYRVSGFATIIVANDGTVYEKDLGNDTPRAAQQLKDRPASGWRAVQ